LTYKFSRELIYFAGMNPMLVRRQPPTLAAALDHKQDPYFALLAVSSTLSARCGAANHEPAPQHVRRPPTLDTMTGQPEAAVGEFDRAPGRYPDVAEHLDQQRAIERHDAAGRGPCRPFLTPERISIPDDLEDRSLPKASGKVTMPRHIAWSFPYSYNLDSRKSLRSCYQRVMTEGLDDDVRFYIDLDVLLEVWDELWLSPHVRDTWSVWLRGRGLID